MLFSTPLKHAARQPWSLASSAMSLRSATRAMAPTRYMTIARNQWGTQLHGMAKPVHPVNQSLKLLLGSTLLGAGIYKSVRPIGNDSAHLPTQDIASNVAWKHKAPVESRFGGSLNYEELTIGSITGLFLGILAGKLSSVLAIVSLSGYFLVQFLETRGIISIPWTSIVSFGKEKVDLKSLVLHKPSFKISFALTFLIAAYNI